MRALAAATPRWAVAAAALVLAGCASSVANPPAQNILMFNSDGRPIDPRAAGDAAASEYAELGDREYETSI